MGLDILYKSRCCNQLYFAEKDSKGGYKYKFID